METVEFIISSLDITANQEEFLRKCQSEAEVDLIKTIQTFATSHPDEFNQISYITFEMFAQMGNLQVVQYMIKHCDIDPSKDVLSLFYACQKANLDMVELLIDNGAEVEACNNLPLIISCTMGSTEIVEYLLQKGADVHAVQDSPIISAALCGHEELFDKLLEYGANPYAQESVIIKKACIINNKGILDLFLRKGLRIDQHGDESLSFATAMGNMEIMRLLIENGVNPKANNLLAFRVAIEMGMCPLLSFLIDILPERENLSRDDLQKLLSFGESFQLGSLCCVYLRAKLGISFESQFPLDLNLSNECPICLNDSSLVLPCRHVICGDCLLKLSDNLCPVCRLNIDKQFIKRKI